MLVLYIYYIYTYNNGLMTSHVGSNQLKIDPPHLSNCIRNYQPICLWLKKLSIDQWLAILLMKQRIFRGILSYIEAIFLKVGFCIAWLDCQRVGVHWLPVGFGPVGSSKSTWFHQSADFDLGLPRGNIISQTFTNHQISGTLWTNPLATCHGVSCWIRWSSVSMLSIWRKVLGLERHPMGLSENNVPHGAPFHSLTFFHQWWCSDVPIKSGGT